MHPHRRFYISLFVAAVAAVAFFALNIFFGSVHIAPATVVDALWGRSSGDGAEEFIVLSSRVPQAVAAALCGAGLAAAGLMLQTLFDNPLADPSILGINSGASLGVAIVILSTGGGASIAGIGLSGFALTVAAAFAGAAVVLALLTAMAAVVRGGLVLLIAGIMVGYVISAIVELLSSIATAEGVRSYVFWGMGSFGGVSRGMLPAFVLLMLAAMVFSLTLAKPLDAMLLGNNYAANLGVSVRRMRILVFLATGVLSAVPTAMCGPVAFIGLAVPHIARFASGAATHRRLMPLAMLCGAAVAEICNLVCNLPSDGTIIPLNVVTSLWGVPVVFYVLMSARRSGTMG